MVLLLVRAEVAAKLARLGFVEVDDAQLGPAAATLEAGAVKLQQSGSFYHNLKSTKGSAQLLRKQCYQELASLAVVKINQLRR